MERATHLHDLIARARMLSSNLERPVFSPGVVPTEAHIHPMRLSELVVAAVSQVCHDLRLLFLCEARASESSDSKLLECVSRWLVRFGAMVAVSLREQVDESTNCSLRAVEEASTLRLKDALDGEPRVLVERCDQAFKGADEATLGEWRLAIVSICVG